MKLFRLAVLSLVTLLALAAAGCQDHPEPPSPDQPSQPVMRIVTTDPVVSTASGLVFDLAEGIDQPDPRPALPVAPAQPLSDADARRLLGRLPALEAAADDVQSFVLPPQTLPAPRAGAVVQEPFPPPEPAEPAPETEPGPLQVLRYAPEGEVARSPNLNLTFNQPMVALTSIADLAAQDAPVILSPQPAGQWRWVGTKTLVFEPVAPTCYAAGRFPMATAYTVTVPAGTRSAVGGVLDKALTFSFSTPPPQAVTTYPTRGPIVLDPLLFIAFDQRIDPAAVLETISAQAGAAQFALRLASDEEVAADRRVQQLAGQARPGCWLALRAAAQLPPDTQVVVRIGPGVPSLEGPLASVEAQTFAFQTYGPLKITEQRCGWGGECTPFMPWHIHFSNALDASSVTSETVRITPALPGAQVDVYGNTLKIQGQSAGRTTYTVQLGAQLSDHYGQILGREESVRFAVGSAQPFLARIGSDMVVLDPYARPALSVYTVNLHRLAVEAYAVSPDDWAAYQTLRNNLYRGGLSPTPPGELVLSTTVPIETRTDTLTETVVDLRPALPSGTGHLIVVIEAQSRTGVATERVHKERTAYIWVQATQIGLDALVDGQQMVAWANSLADGAPLASVELRLLPGERSAVTSADGVATLPLPSGVGAWLLAAQQGDDVAFLPASYYGEGWRERPLQDSLAWYVFDDRGLYRPDEEVHVKGWVRRIGAGPRGDVGLLDGAAESVSYELRDSRGNRISQGSADLNALGGFDFSFQLPSNINLGNAILQLDASGGAPSVGNRRFQHPIPVQEFRRPEFEVQTAAGPGPYFVGEGADLEVTAAYYAGGGLPNADVTWAVSSRPGSYSPPGWDDFTFGRWRPWWRYPAWDESGVRVEEVQSFSGLTDAAGVHRLRIDFRSVTPPEPSVVTAEATVQDVNRQAWAASTNLLVHPADLYVGLRSERLFVQRDQPLPVDAIVADLDGAAVAGIDVEIEAERLVWRQSGDQWREEAASSETCRVTSALEPVGCRRAGPAQPHGDHPLGQRRPAPAGPPGEAGGGAADPRPPALPAGRRGRDPGAGPLLPGRGPADVAALRPAAQRALPHGGTQHGAARAHRGRPNPQPCRAGGLGRRGRPRRRSRIGCGQPAPAARLCHRPDQSAGSALAAHPQRRRNPGREQAGARRQHHRRGGGARRLGPAGSRR
jgi:alpha-2-macroglobulin